MTLSEIVRRTVPSQPWAEGDKIPWNDPAFSRRMLKQHLSQDHDWASRRLKLVDEHVEWIEQCFLEPHSRVLDLGCGPGLYTHRFAERGHDCVGIDFSPASINYAKFEATADDLTIDYRLADVRQAEFSDGFNLAMMIYGEFNVFRQGEMERILGQARSSLKEGGLLLVECHCFEEVQRQGQAPPWWQADESGLFGDSPYLWLEEHFWNPECSAATTRYLIIDAQTGETTQYASTMQAYTERQVEQLLTAAGFSAIRWYPRMGKTVTELDQKLRIVVGQRDR